MDATTREDFFWLMSDAATPLLDRAVVSFRQRENPVRLARTLRKDISPARSALVMEQAQLRLRAAVKFGRAEEMFFTRRGLEQATGATIARYKASQFADCDAVADICCGIGGDLIALADRHAPNESLAIPQPTMTIGVDADELTAQFAERNCAVAADQRQPEARVSVQPVTFEDFDLQAVNGLHCDPDRRGKEGRSERTVHGSRFDPSLESVLERAGGFKLVGIKVAPATPAANSWPKHIEREWIGDRRECKQQVLWLGEAAKRPGQRTATCVDDHGVATRFSVPEAKQFPKPELADEVGDYVYEPHPAILAARLGHILGSQNELKRVADGVAYLTGNQTEPMPLITAFRVREVLPMNLRTVADMLKANDVGTLEVKRRGVEQVAGDQFSKLKLTGSQRVTVILTRLGTTRLAIVADRVVKES